MDRNPHPVVAVVPVAQVDEARPPIAEALLELAGRYTEMAQLLDSRRESLGDDSDEAGEDESFRLVVFGDSDFLTDLDIANAGNAILATNAFNWLVEREDLVGIPPRDVEQVSLFLTQQQMRNLLLLVLIAMPGAAVLAGILVWRRRRH